MIIVARVINVTASLAFCAITPANGALFLLESEEPPPPPNIPSLVAQQPTDLASLELESSQSFKRVVTGPFPSVICKRLSALALSPRCHPAQPIGLHYEGGRSWACGCVLWPQPSC